MASPLELFDQPLADGTDTTSPLKAFDDTPLVSTLSAFDAPIKVPATQPPVERIGLVPDDPLGAETQEDFIAKLKEHNRKFFDPNRRDFFGIEPIANAILDPIGTVNTAAQVAGGAVIGSFNWLLENVATIEGAVGLRIAGAAGLVDERSAKQSLDESAARVQGLMTQIGDYPSETIMAYMGRPTDAQAQNILQGLGELVEMTAGWAGNQVSGFLGGLIDEGISEKGGTLSNTLEEAKPWVEYVSKFGTELGLFWAAPKVGRYVGKKIKAKVKPPRTADQMAKDATRLGEQATAAELKQAVEMDFSPRQAAQNLSKDIKLTLEQGATATEIRRQVGELLEPDARTRLNARLTEAKALHQEVVQMASEGTLANTVRAQEYVRQGMSPDAATRAVINDAANHVRRVEIQQQAHTSAEGLQMKAAQRTIENADIAAQKGQLPVDYKGQGLDPVSGLPVPFPGPRVARNAAVKITADQGGLYRVRRVPGEKRGYVLEEVEPPGRKVEGRKGPFTEKGAKRKQTILERKGISTDIIAVEGGHVLRVKSYTAEAARTRIGELKERPRAVETIDLEPTPLESAPTRPAPPKTLVEEGVSADVKLDSTPFSPTRGVEFRFAGLPIEPGTAARIRELAREAGKSVKNFLRDRGYNEASATTVASAIKDQMLSSEHAPKITPPKLKDTQRNRKLIRRNVERLGEAAGMLVKRDTKKGKPLGQFSEAEISSAFRELAKAGQDAPLLRDVSKLLYEKRQLTHRHVATKDIGWADYVQETLGKPWSKDLTVNELSTLRNALLNRKEFKGQKFLRQKEGMRPITEYDLGILAKTMNEKPQGLLEGTIWFAKRMDRVVPGFSDVFFWPFQRALHRSMVSFMDKRTELRAKVSELGLKRADMKHIGQYAIWQQTEGKAYLQRVRGMSAAPKLNPQQRAFYEYMRNDIYEPIFQQINQARAAAGLDPMTYTENYFTFFRDLKAAAETGLDLIHASNKQIDRALIKSRQAYFRNAKTRRVLSELPIAENAQSVIERYMYDAYKHIHMTPELAFARSLIESQFSRDKIVSKHGADAWPAELEGFKSFTLKAVNKEMYEGLNAYINYISGMPIKGAFPQLNSVAAWLNRSLAYSVLAFNVGSAARQFGAWRNSWHATSTRDMIRGIASAANEFINAEPGTRFGEGKFKRGARAQSEVLLTRTFDVIVEHTMDVLEGKKSTASLISEVQSKLGTAGLKPLQMTDGMAAVVGWHAARSYGKRKLGLSGQELTRYADKVFLETQGSGTTIARPPALRDPFLRSVLLFQTYVLNDWSYLTRNVLGFKDSKPTIKKVRSAIYYVAVTAAITEMFEAIGIRSPFPTPFQAFQQARERGKTTGESLLAAGQELAEPLPLIGGAIRFGSGIGGPIYNTVGDLFSGISGDPFAPPPIVSAAKLAGVPGTAAFWKGYRTLAKDTDDNVRRRARPARRTRRERRAR